MVVRTNLWNRISACELSLYVQRPSRLGGRTLPTCVDSAHVITSSPNSTRPRPFSEPAANRWLTRKVPPEIGCQAPDCAYKFSTPVVRFVLSSSPSTIISRTTQLLLRPPLRHDRWTTPSTDSSRHVNGHQRTSCTPANVLALPSRIR